MAARYANNNNVNFNQNFVQIMTMFDDFCQTNWFDMELMSVSNKTGKPYQENINKEENLPWNHQYYQSLRPKSAAKI